MAKGEDKILFATSRRSARKGACGKAPPKRLG